ncbi:OmpA family protein [Cytophagaceae bacterium ABcell3]|nr:OmpA family protein [Cytophagaceae bacterium ABcell3]
MPKFLRTILLVLPFCFLASAGYGQANDLVEVADEMYRFGNVKDALEVYKEALNAEPHHPRANFMVGVCYLESINKEKSLTYFLKAQELDAEIADNIMYLIGRAYHLGYKFDKAIEAYTAYQEEITQGRLTEVYRPEQKQEELEQVELRIKECINAKNLVKSPVEIDIENLGSVINTEYPEYGPVITPDEQHLFFTSKRRGSTGENKDVDNEYFEDIYYSKREEGGWSEPQNMGFPINTDLHESAAGISADGKTIFLYVDNDTYKGDLFVSTKNRKGKWSHPRPLSDLINTQKSIENSVTISQDGKVLFFSSNKSGGVGGFDLYLTKKMRDGQWGEPENLGHVVNTPFDEESPFLHSDGKTLYFSSKGHEGMGGFDIFKTVYDSTTEQWSKPENIGYPINSPDDDLHFTLSGDGTYGYYSSVKKEGYGDMDIYKIKLPGYVEPESGTEEEPVLVKKDAPDTAETALDINKKSVKLELYVNGGGDSLDANIEIEDIETGEIVYNGTAKEGQLQETIAVNATTLNITAEREGYIFKSFKVKVPENAPDDFKISTNISLDKVEKGARMVLNNIYFDFNRASLQKESESELNKLLRIVKNNPRIKIEIQGHTDSKGTAEYNLDLSQRRAEGVVKWLVDKGVPSDRLIAKGYGLSRPLVSNDDEEEGRELNRRTEFLILDDDFSSVSEQ